MADIPQLSRLMRKADSVAESASVLVKRTMREIRGELANLSTELNLAGSASDREKVYGEIRRRMALLSRRMNKLMEAQNELAARSAAASASKMTGLEVKYSPKRAEAITELVTPAQGENLAAVFTDRMGRNLINSLREATVGMLREQAVAGGSMKDMARDLAARWSQAAKVDDPRFTDASGRTWDTRTYIQMNVRTNTMRVYNDCLLDDVAREVGTDLMRISSGGDPDCDCAAWEGVIISVSGQTKGLPTYEDARNAGCFHPNCTHTLEYVDEVADKKEIELQKAHPVQEGLADDPDAQDERKYEIDQARYMRDNPGMTQEEARIAVDRDNLAASIRSGLVRDDAREIVAKMTDAQVTALCPDGNPPAFEPTKRATRADPHAADEKWNHGSRGGTVHIGRDADAAHILEVCKVKDAKPQEEPKQDPAKSDGPVDFDSLPADQRNALEWYVSGEGQYVNQALRGKVGADFGELTKEEKATIAAMQKATDHPLAKDIGTLYRSVDARAVFGNVSQTQYDMLCDYFRSTGSDKKYYERQIGDIITRTNGKELVEKGFMSTTRDKNVALEWGGFTGSDKPITLELKVAPGVRGINLRKLDVADAPQKEVLLHPNVKYRVLEISHLDGVPYVKAEIITSDEKASSKFATKTDLLNLAQTIERSGKSNDKTLTLAPIDETTAKEIKKVCGVAPKSLTPTIGGDEIRHSFIRHGKHIAGKTRGETQKNQVPITADDIARIPEIIAHRDRIEKGNPEKSRKLQSVKFIKTYPDGTNYAVFVLAGSMDYKTMWKHKP